MDLIELDDHGQAGYSSVQKGGNLECPVEAVEGAAEIEVLESLLSEESIAEDPESDGSISPFFVGFVDLQSLFEFDSVLDNRSAWLHLYLLGSFSDIPT